MTDKKDTPNGRHEPFFSQISGKEIQPVIIESCIPADQRREGQLGRLERYRQALSAGLSEPDSGSQGGELPYK